MIDDILRELELKAKENGYIVIMSEYSNPFMYSDIHEFIEDACNEYIDEIEETSGLNIQEALQHMTEDTALDVATCEYGATLYKIPYTYNKDLGVGDYELYDVEEVGAVDKGDSDVDMDEFDGVDDKDYF